MPARDAIASDIAPPTSEGRTFGYLHAASHPSGAVAPVGIGAATTLHESVLVLAAVAAPFGGRVYRPSETNGAAAPE